MKKIFPISVFLFSLFILPFGSFAQDDRYDAVYLSLTKEYTLHPDGSMDFRFVKQLRLQSYRAFNSLYGETFVVYLPGRQSLKVNECYTTMADGKKIKTPENAFNEVLPGFAANAPAYNSLREMVITHTGLERGAVINLDYSIKSEKEFYPALMGNEVLAETEPVKKLTIRVKIPAGADLSFRVFNGSDQPKKTTENGYQVFTWEMENIPAISAEENQAGSLELYPRLIFSTSGDRNRIYEALSGQEAFGFAVSGKMKEEIQKILSSSAGTLDQVLKLQEKVVNEIRLYPIPAKVTGYTCRTPEKIWNSNGGTMIEKAVLLTAMLRAAGIEAEPVAISRSAFYSDKIGTLADVEDFAVKADLKEEGALYLSVTGLNNQNLPACLAGRTFISFGNKSGIKSLPAGTPAQEINAQGRFICSSDPKITGELSVTANGAINPFLALQRDKNKIKNWVTGGIGPADLKEAKVSEMTPASTFQTFTVQADKPFRKDTLFYYFVIPFVNGGIESWNIKTLASARESALELPAPATEKYSYEITLPDGFSLFYPEGKIKISNKAGEFYFEVKSSKGKLWITRDIRLNERIITPGIYPDFKALLDAWNNPRNREVILKAGEGN
jgi:hypothetical protein